MTSPRLIAALSEIIYILEQCGHVDKSAWLKERITILQDEQATADAREHIANELHAVVLGMGGLMDLSLHPGPGSPLTPTSARTSFDADCGILYELTR